MFSGFGQVRVRSSPSCSLAAQLRPRPPRTCASRPTPSSSSAHRARAPRRHDRSRSGGAMRRSRSRARRTGADITLRGEPGATIAGMAILASTRIVVRDLAVAPAAATAYVRSPRRAPSCSATCTSTAARPAWAPRSGSTRMRPRVVIRDSTFLHCASPMCIRASGADVLVEHNVFDELYDSDAVHGFGSGRSRQSHGPRSAARRREPQRLHPDRRGRPVDDRGELVRRAHGRCRVDLDRLDPQGRDPRRGRPEQRADGPLRWQGVGIFIAGDDRSVALRRRTSAINNNTVVSGLLRSLRSERPIRRFSAST